MKTKTKRLSALFMAFAMSVSVLQATAFAAGNVVKPPDTTVPTLPQGCVGHKLELSSDVEISLDGKYSYNVYCSDDDADYLVTGKAEEVSRSAATCTAPATIKYKVTPIVGDAITETISTGSALGHNYTYTFDWDKYEYLTDGRENLYATVTGICTDCGEKVVFEDQNPSIRVKAAQVGTPVFDNAKPCQPGSVTFTATYQEPATNRTRSAGKTFADTKTYAYYPKYQAHVPGNPQIENIIDPTCTENGSYDRVTRCTVCGEVLKSKSYLLGKTDGHTASPAVKENVVKATYAKGGSYDLVTRCADCGKVLDKVHKTTAKLTVNAPVLSSVKNVKGKKATVAWKKASSVSGYQVQYATSSSFKSAKSVKTTASSKTISKLSKNKKYYVRVRSYKVVSGKTYYSSWSKVKTVTIKK